MKNKEQIAHSDVGFNTEPIIECSGRQKQRELAWCAIHSWQERIGMAPKLQEPDQFLPGREQIIQAFVKEERIGWLAFEIVGNRMNVEYIHVATPYRYKGTARALLAGAILFSPKELRFISGQLGEVNARIFGEVERKTSSVEQGLRATPAYKGRRALGFSRIIPLSSGPDERIYLCTEFDDSITSTEEKNI